MTGKGKPKTINVCFFIAPFLILFTLFAVITYLSTNQYIKNGCEMLERHSLNIAKSYSQRVANSRAATDIIMGLLDEKLLTASKAIALVEDIKDNSVLIELAEKFLIDEISLYDKSGEIINSTTEEMVGLFVRKNHPAYDFMISQQESIIENIRANTKTGVHYKFAYVRREDNSFIQLGVLADHVNEFLHRFELTKLIDEIIDSEEDIENIFFTDTNFKLVASSMRKHTGIVFNDAAVHKHFLLDEAQVGRNVVDGINTLHVCAPVYYNNKKIGTLSIVWSSGLIDNEIKHIVLNNIFRFIMVAITFGSVLYYAYLKSKENVRNKYYDKLTGLPNSEYLHEYLEQKIKNVINNKIAALLLNCTDFGIINMTYGFKYGNNILQQIVEGIEKIINSKHMLFRLESDRFVLIVNGYNDVIELNNLSQQLVKAFEDPIYDMCKHEYLSLKTVIFEIQNKDVTVHQILYNAALGLATLRDGSSKHFVVYSEEMQDAIKRERVIEKILMAILNGEHEKYIHMVFQPKLNIITNRIIGFEALARMNIQGLGYIPPKEFIDLAEKRNLIYPLGNLILKESCKFLVRLKNLGYTNINVSVNISGLQLLRDEFIKAIKEIVDNYHIDYKLLEFEITESVLIDNFELINRKLAEIKNLGISISLDDFGTGYSSFAELRDLNVDSVKIDRYFIEKINRFSKEGLITEDIIAMAHKLGLTVVAEGVEEEYQNDYLKANDCDIIQGFYFSEPLSESDAVNFLRLYYSTSI